MSTTDRDFLESTARQRVTRTALIHSGGTTLTFGELSQWLEQIEALFSSINGQRIGLLIEDRWLYALCLMGAMRSRTAVPLNPAYSQSELADFAQRMSIDWIVVEGANAELTATALGLDIPCFALHAPLGQSAENWQLEKLNELPEPKPVEREPTALVLHTSGSTAEPKVIALTHQQLDASCDNLIRSLALSESDCCLSVLPMFHIGAVVDLLLAPLKAGGSVYLAPDSRATTFYQSLASQPITWYQGVPTMLQDILNSDAPAPEKHQLRLIRSVSSALPPVLHHNIEAKFGVPVVEIYGMSETAGVITSNGLTPEERRVGSVGKPCGPEIKIADDAGAPLTTDETGEIWVRGETVISAYESPESVNATALVDGWLRTGDIGRVDAHGFLYLTGRAKEIINRGGEKIAPTQIDALAQEFPGVREAAAFAIMHPSLGEDVALAVVPDSPGAVDADELLNFLRSQLAAYKTPRKVFFADSLPRRPGGKLERYRLAEMFVGAAQNEQGDDAPLSFFEAKIAAIWKEVLKVEQVAHGDDFFDLGGDSLSALNLIETIRSRLNVDVKTYELFDASEFNAFSELVAVATNAASDPAAEGELPAAIHRQVMHFTSFWEGERCGHSQLIVQGTKAGKQNLFWCDQGEIRHCQEDLQGRLSIYMMRTLFKVDGRSNALNEAIARQYALDIDRIQPQGEIFLGGVCEGAKIAFLTAGYLAQLGRKTACLAGVDFLPAKTDYPFPVELFLTSEWTRNAMASDAARSYFANLSGKAFAVHEFDAQHENVLIRSVLRDAFVKRLPQLPDADFAPMPMPKPGIVIRTTAPRLVTRQGSIRLRVTLQNVSDKPFKPASGAVLRARWLNRQFHCRGDAGRSASLTEELAPGAKLELDLDIPCPVANCRRILELEVVEAAHHILTHGTHSNTLRFPINVMGSAKWLQWIPAKPQTT
ncbi:non-ribosomal peptide synthetase [Cerasicoccus frondis]|uniref:non-ribosomal peptide synthetase n=1 Tax=Cerasicoccus frondis TaxID=490090 RepID=UPI0028528C1C|nr:AMP-binding protein [Cerasicoccus frondis]